MQRLKGIVPLSTGVWSPKALFDTNATRSLTTAASLDSLRKAFSYCSDQVRTYEYDNFIWISQLPQDLRAAVTALRAFNIATALVGDAVKEAPLLQIRMQWWRDAINSCFQGGAPDHPVARALEQVIATRELTQYRFTRILSTRESDWLHAAQPSTMQDLEAYAEGTASQLLYLQLECADIRNAEADHAASHLGKAVGVTTLLRGTAHHAQRRRLYLPMDLCARHGVSAEDVYRGGSGEGVKDVVLQVASWAKEHLEEAEARQERVPRAARPLLLPAVATRLYLRALEKRDFDVFHPQLQGGSYSPLWHQLLVKYNLLRGRY